MPALRPSAFFPSAGASNLDQSVQAYAGSGLFVLNKNSKTASTDPDNPYESEYSTASPEANVVIIPNTRMARYLEIYHLYVGSLVTQPIFQLYGSVPRINSAGPDRLWPYDVDPTNHDNQPRYWLPLEDARTPGNFDITFAAERIVQDITTVGTPSTAVRIGDATSGSVKAFRTSEPARIICAGVAEIMALISTAASNPTAGMLLGRFMW